MNVLVSNKPLVLVLAVTFLLAVPARLLADDHEVDDLNGAGKSKWNFQVGGYMHYTDDEDYEGPPWFAALEYHKPSNWLGGFSVFNNSFGQFSQYAYVGKTFYPSERYPGFRFKITGGVVHGYEGESHKILPVRWGEGWGFAVVPAVGYLWGPVGVDVAVLSASGLLFLVGVDF